MKHSPTRALGTLIGRFSRMGHKYGVEWWILVVGAIIILGIILMAIFAGAIAPYDPFDQDTGPQLAAPSSEHLMGTDNLQRDVFSRIIFGARTILGVAILAAIISSIVGIPLGLISGFSGGVFDKVLSLIMDSVYSFPGLILAIAFECLIKVPHQVVRDILTVLAKHEQHFREVTLHEPGSVCVAVVKV